MTNRANGFLDGLAAASAVPKRVHTQPNGAAEDRETTAASILLVDDDDFVRETVADILWGLGYQVLQASSGEAALEILCNDCKIDIMLTDFVMEDMNGLELARKVSDLFPLMPVVFVSGSAELSEVPSEHPYRLIQKPFRLGDLHAHIEAALGQPRTSKSS